MFGMIFWRVDLIYKCFKVYEKWLVKIEWLSWFYILKKYVDVNGCLELKRRLIMIKYCI